MTVFVLNMTIYVLNMTIFVIIKTVFDLNNSIGLKYLRVYEMPQMYKTSQDCKTLPRVHLIGCQGVNLFLPKDCFKFGQLSRQDLSF